MLKVIASVHRTGRQLRAGRDRYGPVRKERD